jgi:ABC-type bacteriocin/lantibiotic exporter with double-glycine peptidase domain
MSPLVITYLMAALAGFLTVVCLASLAVSVFAVVAFLRCNRKLNETLARDQK